MVRLGDYSWAVKEEIILTVSVKKTRKILGRDFADFSDKEIEDLITKLQFMAKAIIKEDGSI